MRLLRCCFMDESKLMLVLLFKSFSEVGLNFMMFHLHFCLGFQFKRVSLHTLFFIDKSQRRVGLHWLNHELTGGLAWFTRDTLLLKATVTMI